MKFISTRGQVEKCGLIDAFLMGLANDAGLLIPDDIPHVSEKQFTRWKSLSYQDLMFEIVSLYHHGEIPEQDLKQLIHRSYAQFRHNEITPVHKVNDQLYILELFHGPTFAFKDLALQFMGELYAYVAKSQNKIIHILGATSGDTGAAAIAGVRGKQGIKICILHPHQKVSKVQELQMTTIAEDNVLNLSVKGNFDDCQRMIKDLFADLDLKEKYHLRAINSINFIRILAQCVYYFYAYFRVKEQNPTAKVNVSIPTGNFGNVFSGILAKKMGLPIHKMILATNENNILERFIREGVYEIGDFVSTYSPSMDIQIASNFERYLYYLYDGNTEMVSSMMAEFQQKGSITIGREKLAQVQEDLQGYAVGGPECLATIQQVHEQHNYLLDPHTACGVAAGTSFTEANEVCIAFGTAHPAKFNESIQLLHIEQSFPEQIQALFQKQQTMTVVDHDPSQVFQHLKTFLSK
jgi:threonine synthase